MRYVIDTLGSGSDCSVEDLINEQTEKGRRCKILSDEGDKVPGMNSRNRKTVLLVAPGMSLDELQDFDVFGGIFITPITNLPEHRREKILKQYGGSTAEFYFKRKRMDKARVVYYKYNSLSQ